MARVRTIFQPTVETDVDDEQLRVLKHLGHVFTGTDDVLAAHYRAAGLDLPPSVKPTATGGPAKSDQQAKGA